MNKLGTNTSRYNQKYLLERENNSYFDFNRYFSIIFFINMLILCIIFNSLQHQIASNFLIICVAYQKVLWIDKFSITLFFFEILLNNFRLEGNLYELIFKIFFINL